MMLSPDAKHLIPIEISADRAEAEEGRKVLESWKSQAMRSSMSSMSIVDEKLLADHRTISFGYR
jgi:hypothetical protein